VSELPKGWIRTTLGELGVWHGGGTPSKSNAAFWRGAIPWVSPKDMKTNLIVETEDHITVEAVENSATQIVQAGSILVVTRSGILRRILPVAVTNRDVAINQDIKALTLYPNLESEFIARQLRAFATDILSQCAKSGTTVDSVDFDRLRSYPVVLAPELEQRRIVAKLDSLFERTRRAREELSHIPRLIENYKKAILKAAFRGGLTKDWRNRRGVQMWPEKTVGEAISDVRYGTSKKCTPEPHGTPVLRIPNVASQGVDLSDLKYTELAPKEREKLYLRIGDILVVRSNGSADLVGRAVIVDDKVTGYAYAGYLIRLRPDPVVIDSAFLYLMLSSPQVRNLVELNARSTSGVHNINSDELRALPMPMPSLEEQKEVVKLITDAFSWLSTVAEEVSKAAILLNHLDEANLVKAFRGELVPQDPNDEPASVLLERIRAERTGNSRSKYGPRGKIATQQEATA
jgi:type I restriction enzyme, S subunit